MTFSNRCFPTKAVRIWHAGNDADHLALVRSYFTLSGGWTAPEAAAHTPPDGDPLYGVWARRADEPSATERGRVESGKRCQRRGNDGATITGRAAQAGTSPSCTRAPTTRSSTPTSPRCWRWREAFETEYKGRLATMDDAALAEVFGRYEALLARSRPPGTYRAPGPRRRRGEPPPRRARRQGAGARYAGAEPPAVLRAGASRSSTPRAWRRSPRIRRCARVRHYVEKVVRGKALHAERARGAHAQREARDRAPALSAACSTRSPPRWSSRSRWTASRKP